MELIRERIEGKRALIDLLIKSGDDMVKDANFLPNNRIQGMKLEQ